MPPFANRCIQRFVLHGGDKKQTPSAPYVRRRSNCRVTPKGTDERCCHILRGDAYYMVQMHGISRDKHLPSTNSVPFQTHTSEEFRKYVFALLTYAYVRQVSYCIHRQNRISSRRARREFCRRRSSGRESIYLPVFASLCLCYVADALTKPACIC